MSHYKKSLENRTFPDELKIARVIGSDWKQFRLSKLENYGFKGTKL